MSFAPSGAGFAPSGSLCLERRICTSTHASNDAKRSRMKPISILILVAVLLLHILYPTSPYTHVSTMVKTKASKEAELKFVLEDLLRVHPESTLPLAIQEASVISPDDLASLSFHAIGNLKYTDPADNKSKPLNPGDKQLIRMFVAYTHHLHDLGLLPEDWDAAHIDPNDFRRFRMSSEVHTRVDCLHKNIDYKTVAQAAATALQGTNPPNVSGSTPAMVPAAVQVFNKNTSLVSSWRKIPRKPEDYPELTSDKGWESWYRLVKARARQHHTQDVLDPNYVPTTQDEKELWQEQQVFMYVALAVKALTDAGKTAVRKHEKTFDAQQVMVDLVAHYSKSMTATLTKNDVFSEIVNMTIIGWPGTQEQYLLNWHERNRVYTELNNGIPIDTDQKLSLLHISVSGVPNLANVKTTADINATFNNSVLTFDQYWTLLLSTAQQFDATSKHKPTTGVRRRHVLQHDMSYQEDIPDQDSYIDRSYYDVMRTASTPPTSKPKAPRLETDQWHDLDAKGRKAWASLTPSSKAIILRYSTKHRPEDERLVTRLLATHDDLDTDTMDLLISRAAAYQLDDMTLSGDDDTRTSGVTWDMSSLGTTSVNRSQLSTGDPRKALSKRLGKTPSLPDTKSQSVNVTDLKLGDTVVGAFELDDDHNISFRQCSNTVVRYRISQTSVHDTGRDMVDRGANGGVAGSNMRLHWRHPTRTVNIEGYDQHCTAGIPLGTCYNVVQTHRGDVVAIYHNYAFTGKGRSIHSTPQLEAFRQCVDDKSVRVGGLQRLTTHDGYIMPIDIINALPYLKTRACSDDDWHNLPHVIMTSPDEWDPASLDYEHDPQTFHEAHDDGPLPDHRFDERGDYRHRHSVDEHDLNIACGFTDPDLPTVPVLQNAHILQYDVHARHVHQRDPDYAALRPHFLWQSVDVIKRTFEATTQMARVPMSNILRKWFRSPNPALNVTRRNEDVATDTIFSNVPAVDNGATMAQFYCGTTTGVCDVHAMKTEKQIPDTLEDNIRRRGAPKRLLSDHAISEHSSRVLDILRVLLIGSWISEAYMQHQNPAERRWQDVKRNVNTLLDRTAAPEDCWLLALEYVCFILNHLATPSLKHRVPLQMLHGSTVDISIILRFTWFEPVYYRIDDSDFPSDSREGYGYFVGFAENVGHALTYRILTRDTRKIIERSSVRSTLDPADPNLRLEIFDGESVKEYIKSRSDSKRNSKNLDGNSDSTAQDGSNMGSHDTEKDGEPHTERPDLDLISPSDLEPQDLVGRSILLDQQDGSRIRAKILKLIDQSDDQQLKDSAATKFLITMGNDAHEELMTYQQILDHLNQDIEQDKTWKFKAIIGHQGPLTKEHHDYKGSSYNVQIEWENGEITYEPLNIIAVDDPFTCAQYASEHGLLDLPGWKRFKRMARRQKKLIRMVNQAKLRSFRSAPQYMYGIEIPKDYLDAVRLDKINGNTKWQDCTRLEMEQLAEYKTFKSIGYKAKVPQGYKRIRAHLVYAVKHDGRHKARYVADGHLTDIPVDSVYSGVVSLKGLRAMIFIAELNGLQVWGTDIGNAYLEANTLEKVCITAGPEFEKLQGHTLIVVKALYGLRSSGLRWHERFSDCMRNEGFFPCKAEPDIWMRDKGDHYEYVGVYVDDLAFAMKDPQTFADVLQNKYKFKLKGTGPLEFHLGCNFYRNDDGILCMAPTKYIDRMVDNYTRMFNEKPKMNVQSPLEKNDHPELDDSEFLEATGIQQYQSIIGSAQWAISLGRFDIYTAVMTLSSFRSAPRTGHLERAKRLVRYLARFKYGDIKFRTMLPDYTDLPDHNVGWDRTIYHDAAEDLPHDAPTPRGLPILLTRYVDANLYHDWITGRSVTGILTLVNQTPFDWYSGKQPRVETATYGSEFIATRKATEKAIEDRTLFRYLGVPVPWKDYMFGDNESVVNSSTRIDAKLHKRHNALSFHKVREAVAAGFVAYYHVASKYNLADVLSKHWAHNDVWMLLQTVLFWKSGDTADIPDPPTNIDSKHRQHQEDT